MILRLRLNEMDLQRGEQILALLQRQSNQPGRIFGHGRAAADLVRANDPIRTNQLQHHPPLHPELPTTTTGRSHSTPHVLDGLIDELKQHRGLRSRSQVLMELIERGRQPAQQIA